MQKWQYMRIEVNPSLDIPPDVEAIKVTTMDAGKAVVDYFDQRSLPSLKGPFLEAFVGSQGAAGWELVAVPVVVEGYPTDRPGFSGGRTFSRVSYVLKRPIEE